MTARLFDDLHAYYDGHGIGAERFTCSHFEPCSQGSPKFTKAKEAYIGQRFGMDGLPRLLFVSLDSGDGGEGGWQARTMEALQRHEEAVSVDKLRKKKNRHWYQTRDLALRLLNPLRPDLDIHAVHRYFAHTNSAKCCLNLPGRRMAAQRLFDNCRAYIPGELEILAPAILVTQGRWARVAVMAGFDGRITEPRRASSGAGPHRFISLNAPNSTIWFDSHHPRYFGEYKKQKELDWPAWSELIRERFGPARNGDR